MGRKLALDLDSTLAATAEVAFDLILGENDYTYDDIESWDWGLDKFGTECYLSALWHAWTLRPGEIEPTEPMLSSKVGKLHEQYDRVDIVTANPSHLGIEKGKRNWLDQHKIPHDAYVTVEPDSTKADLDYDAFVDDKPALVGRARDDQDVFVYDQRYNRGELLPEGEYMRVSSIGEVTDWHEQWGSMAV